LPWPNTLHKQLKRGIGVFWLIVSKVFILYSEGDMIEQSNSHDAGQEEKEQEGFRNKLPLVDYFLKLSTNS
jgi:hypothetical protein